jgi:hypothetical protein
MTSQVSLGSGPRRCGVLGESEYKQCGHLPKLHATSGGRYAAFLFATYALVLEVAEVVTLSAKP